MRRTVTIALGVASVPIGVGVGLWTALLTSWRYCPPRPGTLDLCAARPIFHQPFSVARGSCCCCGGCCADLGARRGYRRLLSVISPLRPAAH